MLWYTTSSEKNGAQHLGVPLTHCSTEVPHDLLGARHLSPPTRRDWAARSGCASHAIDCSAMMEG